MLLRGAGCAVARSRRHALRHAHFGMRTSSRHAHFVTWPPAWPAKPHEFKELKDLMNPPAHKRYGWGDWWIAGLVGSFCAWPVAVATDFAEDSLAKGLTSTIEAGGVIGFVAGAGASLGVTLPKVAAHYYGVRLYVPQAWWVWQLTALPSLPVSIAFSAAAIGVSAAAGAAMPEVPGVERVPGARDGGEPAFLQRVAKTSPAPVALLLHVTGIHRPGD